MLRVEQLFESDPRLRMQAEQQSKIFPSGPLINNYRTTSIVTIPVVVHIVLPNPDFVTDADVQWQIDKLNLDYVKPNLDYVKLNLGYIKLS